MRCRPRLAGPPGISLTHPPTPSTNPRPKLTDHLPHSRPRQASPHPAVLFPLLRLVPVPHEQASVRNRPLQCRQEAVRHHPQDPADRQVPRAPEGRLARPRQQEPRRPGPALSGRRPPARLCRLPVPRHRHCRRRDRVPQAGVCEAPAGECVPGLGDGSGLQCPCGCLHSLPLAGEGEDRRPEGG